MKKIIAPLVLGTAIGSAMLVTGCANNDHNESGHHAEAEGHHGSMDAGHEKMMQNHHGDKEGGQEVMMNDHNDMKMEHGEGHGMGHHAASLAGKSGKESDVDRTINIDANDNMRFMHDALNIKNGETIKFVVTNKGAISHEFSIGTKDEHMAHGKMMMANPNMKHGSGGPAITIEPGKTEVLVWSFEEAWQVEVACNIPGHYQAGMHSPVQFTK